MLLNGISGIMLSGHLVENKNLTKELPKDNNKYIGLWKISFCLPNKAKRTTEEFFFFFFWRL